MGRRALGPEHGPRGRGSTMAHATRPVSPAGQAGRVTRSRESGTEPGVDVEMPVRAPLMSAAA